MTTQLQPEECKHEHMFVSFKMDCFVDSTATKDDNWEASAAWVDDTPPVVDYSTAEVIFQCEYCGLQVYGKAIGREAAQGDTPIYVPDFESKVDWEDEL